MRIYSVLLIVIMLLNESEKFKEMRGRWSIGNVVKMVKDKNQKKETKQEVENHV